MKHEELSALARHARLAIARELGARVDDAEMDPSF